MDKVVITGVAGDQAPPRLEINDFIGEQKQFALYIQALRKYLPCPNLSCLTRYPCFSETMYSEVQDPRLSYFEISAIHGRPFQDWNGSPTDGKTFCVHNTNLFPTWHRPYVALIEVIHTL
jgi:tyrosinase